jgi:hypothetical protein
MGLDPVAMEPAVLYRRAILKAHDEMESITFELQRSFRLVTEEKFLASLLLREVPRLAALVKAEHSAIALVDQMSALSRRLADRVRTGQRRLIQQFRRDPKAYFAPVQFISVPTFMEEPNDFAIVIDFATGQSMAPFLAAVLGAFEGRSQRTARETILNQLSAAGFRLVVGPRRARLERIRGAPETMRRWELADALAKSLTRFLGPPLKKLWDQVVSDFFLREPTSVSRWFPLRPMARKGLHPGMRRTSLLGMLRTGQVEFGRVLDRGFAGAFTKFQVQLAPYWPVVQYGYAGEIAPASKKYLALRDPPGWRSLTWFLGVPVTTPQISKRGITFHTGVRRIARRPKGLPFFYSAATEQAAMRTTLPASGTRFWFRMKSKAATKPFVPVISTEIFPVVSRKRKVVTYAIKTQITYSAMAEKPAVFQRRVQGQRASLFIERILAQFTKRQAVLSNFVFQAARAYVEFGEDLFDKFLAPFR